MRGAGHGATEALEAGSVVGFDADGCVEVEEAENDLAQVVSTGEPEAERNWKVDDPWRTGTTGRTLPMRFAAVWFIRR